MKEAHEIVISVADAADLRAVLPGRSRMHARPGWAHELADVLEFARVVVTACLPSDRVAIGSAVTYREEPSGKRRTVVLSHPEEAVGRPDRLSVLSPIGLALVGRRSGSLGMSDLPDARPYTLRVVGVSETGAKEMT